MMADVKAVVQMWIDEYETFYGDFGGRNAFFIFILERSIGYGASDAIARAKHSILEWYESNRSLRLMSIRGNIGGAGISPEWLLPLLKSLTAAVVARGVIALGISGLRGLRHAMKEKLIGITEESKTHQGPSFVPDSYLSLFELSPHEREALVEQWAHAFEAFCDEITLSERQKIDNLITSSPVSTDEKVIKEMDSLIRKDFVKLIENRPGTIRAVFMPPGFEMVRENRKRQ
jgi:hypothetical protein